jgi:hypothetical protein
MSSVDETKNLIRQGIRSAEQATKSLEQIGAETGDTTDLARYTTHDSRHQHVTNGLARLTEASRESEILHRRLAGGIEHAREYLDVLG